MLHVIPSESHKEFVKQLRVVNHLQYYRKINGFSQQSLANYCGVSRNTICSIERYEYYPGIKLALVIAKIMNVPVTEIFELY